VFVDLDHPTDISEAVMHAPINRSSGFLPKRFPVGARYVVEGCGGKDGHLRVFSRYVVLPDGQRINVPSDLDVLPPLSAHIPRHRSGRSRFRGATRLVAKKIIRGAGTRRRHRN
jgi:hypothetical protein